MQRSAAYTFRFAAIVSVVGSVLVATTAVVLKERQEANRLLDQRRKVLDVVELRAPGERLTRDEIVRRFEENIQPLAVEVVTGDPAPEIDVATFDQRKATRDPTTSRLAPDNAAGVGRLPNHALLYHLVQGGELQAVILPIEGKGLWSTLYGFLALDADLRSVRGITFYEHAETPGLGAEIDAPRWRALWKGRQVFDADWEPQLEVIKGDAGPPEESPYEVDGLAGATITGRGVSNTVRFWLGPNGFGPYLRRYREERGIT